MSAHLDAAAAWRAVSFELRARIGESAYDIWLAGAQPAGWDGRVLTLQVPPETGRWLVARFGQLLTRCAADVLGEGVDVALADGRAAARTLRGVSRGNVDREHADAHPAAVLHPRYTFHQFVIGEGNRLAHAAALAVAEHPGQAYNPLFLHAPPGLGKTHLLHAIGNYVLAFGAGARVRYTTAEAFTNHFIASLGARSLESFKRAYRDADVLLIDDVQFLADKAKTEEEFFHTFNALYETGRQLVLTCDRLPQSLVSVQQRLRERFEAGLVADIRPPDLATRVTILRKRAAVDGIGLAEQGVLELIAQRVANNIRALEGALIRVVAFHSLTQRPLDRALATEVLDVMYPGARRGPPSIDEIQEAVAAHFKLSVSQLRSGSRAEKIAWPRQLAIHLARELTGASFPVIGRAFDRNHATILHACRRVSERLTADPQAVEEIDKLTRLLGAEQADR
ncbi:MAG: chromosomal replication initiator protein DnaA [Solirubrobacteraceae bacterium]